ncbi:hypothetical protein ACVIJU_003651 [Aeribacillus sp. SP014]
MYFLAGSKTIAKLNNLFKYPRYLGLKRINVKMVQKGMEKADGYSAQKQKQQ